MFYFCTIYKTISFSESAGFIGSRKPYAIHSNGIFIPMLQWSATYKTLYVIFYTFLKITLLFMEEERRKDSSVCKQCLLKC